MAAIVLGASPAGAFEVTDTVSFDSEASAAVQCEVLAHGDGDSDCGAAGLVQPVLDWQPNDNNELAIKVGFAAGNSLENITPFNLTPWGADLEAEVVNINGRNRDYLLTAWYQHTFALGENTDFAIAGGLIDSTDYIDLNAYANDELEQFMNDGFINSVLVEPPSYDYGVYAQFNHNRWDAIFVYMNVGGGENESAGLSYNYFAGEIGYDTTNAIGPGKVRVLFSGTDARFGKTTGETLAPLFGITTSIDQRITHDVGVFVRAGWQLDEAEIDYGAEITAGGSIYGGRWGRDDDVIGFAGGGFFGGNGDLDSTLVAEAFYLVAISDELNVAASIQGIRDVADDGTVTAGGVFSLRTTMEF